MNSFNFKKRYGQNFLIDKNITQKIVDIPLKKKSLVIEIGPGDGKLTKYLCSSFDKVICYEIDLDLKNRLIDNLKEFNNYEIYFCDFLKRDVIADLKKEKYDNLYVIANLPYYITTPILEKLISLNLNIEIIRIMVQKEVGDRFCAKVGTREYSSITVYLNYNFNVKKEFVVSRNYFYPKPNVDSVVVSLYKKDKTFVNNLDLLNKLILDSFKFKRKTLRNNLKGYDLKKIDNVLKKYNMDLSIRAEQISVDVFCEIANELFS